MVSDRYLVGCGLKTTFSDYLGSMNFDFCVSGTHDISSWESQICQNLPCHFTGLTSPTDIAALAYMLNYSWI